MATKKATRKGRTPVDANETPEQKFRRLANKRVARTLNDLKLCANLGRYAHTPEQGQKILAVLANGYQSVADAFSKSEKNGKPTFEI